MVVVILPWKEVVAASLEIMEASMEVNGSSWKLRILPDNGNRWKLWKHMELKSIEERKTSWNQVEAMCGSTYTGGVGGKRLSAHTCHHVWCLPTCCRNITAVESLSLLEAASLFPVSGMKCFPSYVAPGTCGICHAALCLLSRMYDTPRIAISYHTLTFFSVAKREENETNIDDAMHMELPE